MNKSVTNNNMSVQDRISPNRNWGATASGSRLWKLSDIRFSDRGIAAPEADWQPNHEESMGAQVGGNGKVTIKGGSAQLLLHPS